MRPAQAPPSFRTKLFYASFAGVSMLIIVFVFYFYQNFYLANVRTGREPIRYFIAEQTSFEDLMAAFREERIFENEMSFRLVAKFLKFDTPKPGWYLFEKDTDNLTAIRMLRAGDQIPLRITFNNIRLPHELAGKLTQYLKADSAALLQKLQNPEIAQKYGFNEQTFLCMFLPNTYEFFWTTDADALLDRMKREYDKFWNEKRQAQAQERGLSPVEVSILASIVDAETIHDDEKPKVAGVYLNRLQRGQRLEADPTVVFALGDFSIKRVLLKHLEVESPYNTYRNTGLPPGPIRLPSIAGIEAVLQAEEHDLLFFCAREDFSGYHNFARTAAEHSRNAERYRRALNQRGIR
ncbi:MAG: endolytic transglycosylase MltG [Bernardetiaceae bacterium]